MNHSRLPRLSVSRVLISAAVIFSASAAHADSTLDRVNDRKTIVVGVAVGGGPFGSIDPVTSQLQGFNVWLAQDLAARLGVRAELVSVTPPTRIRFLQQGKVDVLIANMELTDERKQLLGYVPTPYYRVGGAAIVRGDSDIHQWEDLRGKPVCDSQGSSYTKPLEQRYGAIVKGFPTSAESLLAFRGNLCVAAVHDNEPQLSPLVRDNPEWRNYRLLQPDLSPSLSVIWTRKDDTALTQRLDLIVQQWHRSGWLLEQESRAGLAPPSPLLLELNARFKNTQ